MALLHIEEKTKEVEGEVNREKKEEKEVDRRAAAAAAAAVLRWFLDRRP